MLCRSNAGSCLKILSLFSTIDPSNLTFCLIFLYSFHFRRLLSLFSQWRFIIKYLKNHYRHLTNKVCSLFAFLWSFLIFCFTSQPSFLIFVCFNLFWTLCLYYHWMPLYYCCFKPWLLLLCWDTTNRFHSLRSITNAT